MTVEGHKLSVGFRRAHIYCRQIGLPLAQYSVKLNQPVNCVAEIQRHVSILWVNVLSLRQKSVYIEKCQQARFCRTTTFLDLRILTCLHS